MGLRFTTSGSHPPMHHSERDPPPLSPPLFPQAMTSAHTVRATPEGEYIARGEITLNDIDEILRIVHQKNGSHPAVNLRHLCNICVPDWADRLVLTVPRIIDVCDVCSRREGSDYGNVQIRAFRDTPDLPKLGPIEA